MSTAFQRGRFQGVAQIVRFNWPMYVFAAVAGVVGVGLALLPLPAGVRVIVAVATAGGLYFVVGSLAVSFWVYDVSRLFRWDWVADELPNKPGRWLNIHCGFDESTPSLRRLFPGTGGRSLDIFEPNEMTEPSIARARRMADPNDPGEPADYRRLSAEDESVDAAFLMLSAHELRSESARVALFAELRRVVRADGRVVVAEHVRDAANFVAFGPGFTHFHSRSTWRRTFAGGGWAVERTLRITPFVAVFVLRRMA